MADNRIDNDVAAASDIRLEIFDDFDTLAAIQPQWDDFIEAVDGGIYLSYDWCRLWWKYYGQKRDLKIFLFWHESALVGLIPLFFETVWLGPVHIRAAKIVGSDSTISQIGLPVQAAFIPTVMKGFFAELCSAFKWDIICLGPFAGQYRDLGFLYHTCRRLLSKQLHVKKIKSGEQTYFELADSWEKYLDGLTGRKKEEFTRTYGMFAKTVGSTVSDTSLRIADMNNIDEMFASFVQMHQLQWKELGKLGHFGDWPGSEEFHREIAHAQLIHDRLRLLEVRFQDCCLGYEYNFKYGGKYLNFLGARFVSEQLARVSIGKITFGEMVKKAISEGINCIDSSQGRYEHKLRMGGKMFPIHKIEITSSDPSTRIRIEMFKTLARLLHIGYYRIWFCRLAPRLPFKRGPLWKSWIKSTSFV